MATDQGRCKRGVNPAADDAFSFVRGLIDTSINRTPTAPTVTLALNGTARPTPALTAPSPPCANNLKIPKLAIRAPPRG